jgi:hypothetical protein
MESILCKADFFLVDMEPRDNVTLSLAFQVDVERVDISNSVATLSSGTSLFDYSISAHDISRSRHIDEYHHNHYPAI